ncbi:MAG: alpha/beta fold hydrolase [Planctomycetales bacterium]|nr:alpha/beta fold hydrolase [Planctomycetales bacterium]NIM09622.1 alpha/beta fold hydrolase [Planctomycetales bacterium]NIN09105.1 alpha/beta fold hydrolase [Planctomycetales bacterium]NIN78212.1 alpha/beta fold hydrolase [Planctomycetales bacterium]NIO35403.1 alpha/beta fold hydrolase [Planctomycetales bacterium]
MPSSVDWKALYPFESRWFSVDGYRCHYLDEGSGQPLLMVHGNPTWSFYWRDLVLALRDRYRVIVPDHIGCGWSDKPIRYPYHLGQHTQNLQRLVQHLDLRQVTLLAHDWGGPIGLGAAVAEKDRYARFVLFNTGAYPPPYFPWRIRICRTPLLGRLAVQGLNLFARAALSMAVRHHERMEPPVCQGLLAPYDCWAHRTAIYRFVKDIPASRRHPTYAVLADLEAQLHQLADRPMMFVWGMRDWCFRPECLDRFLEIFPEAEVHRLDDAGHYVVQDAHERIVPLVGDFLERNPVNNVAGIGCP